MRNANTRALCQLTVESSCLITSSGGYPPALAREQEGEKGRRGWGQEGGGDGASERERGEDSEPGAKFLSDRTADGVTLGRTGAELPSHCSHTALAWGIQGQGPLGGS